MKLKEIILSNKKVNNILKDENKRKTIINENQ
jgi:hypothetical protein